MATIGTFTAHDRGFRGTLRTLTLSVELEFRPHQADHDKAPDFRILAGTIEIGAAWRRTSAAEREYLSCKLDDPMLPAPLFASLVASNDDEHHLLVWSR